MTCGIDLPSWINAVSVVALAVITAWYAHTTRNLLREARDERAERLRELRRPVATLLDEIKRDITASKALLAATTFEAKMDGIPPSLGRSYVRLGEVADLYRDRSERVYRLMSQQLRPTIRALQRCVENVVGDVRANRDRGDNSDSLAKELDRVAKILDETECALNAVR